MLFIWAAKENKNLLYLSKGSTRETEPVGDTYATITSEAGVWSHTAGRQEGEMKSRLEPYKDRGKHVSLLVFSDLDDKRALWKPGPSEAESRVSGPADASPQGGESGISSNKMHRPHTKQLQPPLQAPAVEGEFP